MTRKHQHIIITITIMLAIAFSLGMAMLTARSANAGPECVGDIGRCHGYMPAGFIGAHPSAAATRPHFLHVVCHGSVRRLAQWQLHSWRRHASDC